MQEVKTERWKILCEQASKEQDPEKLFELIYEINHLLEPKLNGLDKGKNPSNVQTPKKPA